MVRRYGGSGSVVPRPSRRAGARRTRPVGLAMVLVLVAPVLAACSSSASATPTLNWYINPDNGGQVKLAARCSAASNRRDPLRGSALPNPPTGPPQQLRPRPGAP